MHGPGRVTGFVCKDIRREYLLVVGTGVEGEGEVPWVWWEARTGRGRAVEGGGRDGRWFKNGKQVHGGKARKARPGGKVSVAADEKIGNVNTDCQVHLPEGQLS